MDAKHFSELLTNPSHLKDHSVEELRQLAADHPYSQPVQLLYTIKLNNTSEYLFNRQLGRTSILSDDRSVLFDLFERPRELRPGVAEPFAEEEDATISAEPTTEQQSDEVIKAPEEEKEAVKAATEEEAKVAEEDKPEGRAESVEKSVEMNPARPEETHSPKDRIQQILEENRRLRKQYEKDRGGAPLSEFEQRVDAIRQKLHSLKPTDQKSAQPEEEKKEELSSELNSTESKDQTSAPEIVPEPEQQAAETEAAQSPDEKEYSAEEEALVEAHNEEEGENQFVDEISNEPVEAPVAEQRFEIEPEAEKPEPEQEYYPEAEEPEEKSFEENAAPAESKKPASFFEWLHQLEERGTVIRKADENQEPQESFEEKIQLLDSFVERLPQLKRKKPLIQKAGGSKLEVGKLGDNEEDGSLVTETLAKVYLKQQHYRKAIKAYEILKLKYPEKSGLFADQISEIKKLINSK